MLIWLIFFVVHGDLNASRLLRHDHQSARMQRGRVMDQTCHKVLVQGGGNFLDHDGIDAVWLRRDRSASFWDRIHENTPRSRNQSPAWTWRKRLEIHREHFPAAGWLQESSPGGREHQTPPLTDVTADVPRRAGTKSAVLGLNVQVEQPRVGRSHHRCEMLSRIGRHRRYHRQARGRVGGSVVVL